MLRWAILGTGFISGTVASAIAQSDGSRVEIVSGRNAERLADFQAEHGIRRGITDYREAVADHEVDVVYIGLPNHLHLESTLAAAAAGKAVLCEKSLTTDMAAADALIDGVEARGTFFVEGLMYLAHPLFERVVELVADGRLGTVRSIDGRYAADIWQLVNPAGKGTIYNLGCYPVSLLQLVIQSAFGEEAFAGRALSGAGNLNGDGNICDAALAVRFDNGVLATLQSTDSFGDSGEFSIAGDRGVLRFETNPWLPAAGDNVLTWREFGPGYDTPEVIVVKDGNDAFHHQIKLVERCLAAGLTEAPRPSPRLGDSREIMAMLTEWEAASRR